MGERDRLREAGRGPAPEADDGVGVCIGDCGPSPLGELERHVLHDLVPLAHDERAQGFRQRVAELLRLRIDDEEDTCRPESGELVTDPAQSTDGEDGAARQRVVGERPHAARSAASAASSFDVGGSVTSSSLASRSVQPVAATACSAVTPGWSAVCTSSPVSGSGRRMPRSVMTIWGPRPRRPEALAIALAVAEADRRAEVAALDERARPLPNDDDDLACGCRDLGSAARTRQSRGRMLVVADDRRVDVAVAVELRGAEEADVDASGLQPVGEDLGHRYDRVGGVREITVADREREPRRLRPDASRLVDQRAFLRVRAAGEVRGSRRQPDAHEAHAVVTQLPGGADDHQVVGAPLLRHEWLPARCQRCGSTPRSRRCRARACRSRP